MLLTSLERRMVADLFKLKPFDVNQVWEASATSPNLKQFVTCSAYHMQIQKSSGILCLLADLLCFEDAPLAPQITQQTCHYLDIIAVTISPCCVPTFLCLWRMGGPLAELCLAAHCLRWVPVKGPHDKCRFWLCAFKSLLLQRVEYAAQLYLMVCT
jgi:hypothetical protein